jgi:carbonic anhydrase/acetyltransferase-like protein (isoleucine patch superfamily)
LTDCIVGANATIGKGSTLKDCKVGPQFRVEAATEAKNEILCEDD